MKKLLFALFIVLLSCDSDRHIVKDIYYNVVITAVDTSSPTARTPGYHEIYISTPKKIIVLYLDYENRDKYHVGDTIKTLFIFE